jgi:nitrogen fixation/metabolism regulation signal transduction histidine kinase
VYRYKIEAEDSFFFTTVVVALALALPLLRQMTQNFRALLRGADRVASGNLAEPVQVSN